MAQDVAPIKDFQGLAQVTTWKAYAVKAGAVLLVLCLVNDIYKRRIVQGIAHLWCLGMTWVLHNALYVKDLEELVPVLGAAAERYTQEIDRLSQSVDTLEKATQEFKGMSREDIAKRKAQLEQERTELLRLTEQRARLEGAIEALGGHVRQMSGVLDSPHVKALSQHPLQVATMLKTDIAAKMPDNQEANTLANRLVEVLTPKE